MTYTAQVKKDDALIRWHADACTIERMTRAYNPWPVARTSMSGEDLLVWRARMIDDSSSQSDAPLGTVLALSPIQSSNAAAASLALLEVQAPGRRRMAATDFMRGRRVAIGSRLGA